MKRIWSMIFAVLSLSILLSMPVFAKAKIKSIDYEGKGRIEVEFSTKVQYKGLKIAAKDEKGNKLKAVLIRKDNDDLKFRITNIPEGEKVSFTISGIKKKTDKKYASVTGEIWVATCTGGIKLKDVDYDASDREVEFEFLERVQWKSPKVVITNGKTVYSVRITDKDSNSIEAKVKKLTKGTIYQYTISGISKKGKNQYVTLKGKFKA